MSGLTMAEAGDMLHLSPETLKFLTGIGPFEPVNDNLTPRQVFGVSLVLALGMLPAADAVPIAVNAAFDAVAGGDRWLCVSWPDRTPVARWLDHLPQDARGHLPIFAIPADSLLDLTIARIAERNGARAKAH